MWTKIFWKRTAERAIKSAAQAGLGLWLGETVFNVFSVPGGWMVTVGILIGAALISLATSLVSSGAGNPEDPSLV